MEWKSLYFKALRFGVFLLWIQNIFLTFIIYFGSLFTVNGTSIFDDPVFEFVLFLIDIIGFALMGLSLYLLSYSVKRKENAYASAGLFILFWVFLRVFWQYFLGTNIIELFLSEEFYNENLETIFQVFAIIFIAGGISLFMSSLYLIRIRGFAFFYLIFTAVNAFGAFMMASPFIQGVSVTADELLESGSLFLFGFAIKVLIVPILGIVAFTFILVRMEKMKQDFSEWSQDPDKYVDQQV